ncbi:MAG: RNA-binding protein [Desulfomicrobium escambiense]|nr:RNA-binding protein [Desulfomicrobium escambiense]
MASVAIIKDKYSRQSKGFGFVEMETEDEAKKAIEQFNGGELQGKKIVVSEAREPRKDGEGGGLRPRRRRTVRAAAGSAVAADVRAAAADTAAGT